MVVRVVFCKLRTHNLLFISVPLLFMKMAYTKVRYLFFAFLRE